MNTDQSDYNTPRRGGRFGARLLGLALAGAIALAACGGADDSNDSDDAPTPSETTLGANGIAPPDATLPADLPEEFAKAYRPIEFSGKQLPAYDSNAAEDPAIGLESPTFTAIDINEEPYKLDPATEGNTMIVMVAHWCPVCNEEVPQMIALHDEGDMPEDLNVVAILTSSRPGDAGWPPNEWIVDIGWPYETVYDGLVEAEVNGQRTQIPASGGYYGFQGVPSIVLVNEEGIVVDRWSGGIGKDSIRERIQAAFGA